MKTGGNKTLQQLERDLSQLASYVARSPAAQRFLADPTQSRAEKKATVASFVGAPQKNTASSIKEPLSMPCPLMANMLQLLAENGRLALLPKIITAFDSLLKAHRRQIDVAVVSAAPLPAPYMKRVTDQLVSQFIPADTTPLVTNQVLYHYDFSPKFLHNLFIFHPFILLNAILVDIFFIMFILITIIGGPIHLGWPRSPHSG
jgi:F0F1-type ATP synthase delta subunit